MFVTQRQSTIACPQEEGNMKIIINLTPLDEVDHGLFLYNDFIKIPTRTEYNLNSQDLAVQHLVSNQVRNILRNQARQNKLNYSKKQIQHNKN
ncbi:hypothetical protein TTHERM_00035340 (macronuclear) [Tetrahymena thermophila SB210]|uniref:Uncharacterized protein n=1 Tax=Tetrahymena thermophila (strain SB210) TaxID=312017 RepID=Q22MI6_TETTS|nr:hypothetical protein TTHERM_00035340 [Tetrahymena thermophila SB210]EAR86614.1 hypothetical protein TTHERM_00035340 [Tetrahymena thermophila SB210]|eukprot:XP_977034.1 hypothetical protein TTHERM_00035340 [Tetrahymena thermophila SB210]